MINLGDKVSVTPVTFGRTETHPKAQHMGVVVYVHPKRRFFTAEFELPGGRVRESFQFFRER